VIAWIDRLPWVLAFLAAAWLLPRRVHAAGMLVVPDSGELVDRLIEMELARDERRSA